MSALKNEVKKIVDVVLELLVVVFMFAAIFLGLILSVDLAGLSIYSALQGVSWNFHNLSWVLLAEGFVLIIFGTLALGGRDYRIGTIGPWIVKGIRMSKLGGPPNLYEVGLALALLGTGIILFFFGLMLFGT